MYTARNRAVSRAWFSMLFCIVAGSDSFTQYLLCVGSACANCWLDTETPKPGYLPPVWSTYCFQL